MKSIRPYLAALASAIAVMLLVSPPAAAQASAQGPAPGPVRSSVFDVDNVPVDATAANASDARAAALAQGETAAYGLLLRRLTLESDWGRLPGADKALLDRIITGFEVNDERRSATRYIARLSYSFSPREIRSLLRGAGIPFSETRAKPIAVLPVLRMPSGEVLLWEPQNVWAAAWRDKPLAQALVPFIVPLGDLDDVAKTRGFSVEAPTWASVAALAQKVGADKVLAPYLAMRRVGQGVQGDVRLISVSAAGASESRVVVQGANQAAAMDNAIAEISSGQIGSWKRSTVVSDATVAGLTAFASYSSFQEWLAVRRGIEAVPSVRNVRVVGLAADGARISISYIGSPDQLRVALAQADLVLDQGIDGSWTVMTEAAAQNAATAATGAPPPGSVPQ